MKIRHPNGHHTYSKTDSVRYSLAYSHTTPIPYPPTLLVTYYFYFLISPHSTHSLITAHAHADAAYDQTHTGHAQEAHGQHTQHTRTVIESPTNRNRLLGFCLK